MMGPPGYQPGDPQKEQSAPQQLDQANQNPGSGCERDNNLAPRRGSVLKPAPRSRVTKPVALTHVLHPLQRIDTPPIKRVRGGEPPTKAPLSYPGPT